MSLSSPALGARDTKAGNEGGTIPLVRNTSNRCKSGTADGQSSPSCSPFSTKIGYPGHLTAPAVLLCAICEKSRSVTGSGYWTHTTVALRRINCTVAAHNEAAMV